MFHNFYSLRIKFFYVWIVNFTVIYFKNIELYSGICKNWQKCAEILESHGFTVKEVKVTLYFARFVILNNID